MATQAAMFDHAVVVCPDLDAGAQAWQRLGFTLTPRGYHTLGSQNHCIMLERDYVELLHVTAPSPSRQYYWDAQQRGRAPAEPDCVPQAGRAGHAVGAAAIRQDRPGPAPGQMRLAELDRSGLHQVAREDACGRARLLGEHQRQVRLPAALDAGEDA